MPLIFDVAIIYAHIGIIHSLLQKRATSLL
jgi:hypothetical protein